MRRALEGSGVELVGVSDDRPVDFSVSPAAVSPLSAEDLRSLGPDDLAADRLAEPDLHLTAEQRAEFGELLAEAIR